MKTEHGVPIPRRAAVVLVVGYLAAAAAYLALVLDAMPHRWVIAGAGGGLAAVAFTAAYPLLGETRRQSRVVRAALGYRWGERPWTWSHHVLNGTLALAIGLSLGAAREDDQGLAVISVLAFLWGGVIAVSAVQKRRHERSDRERFGPPESYEAAQRFG
ncbi:hypothetical protein [Nocardioides zeae]|uniref:Uncharacterized protein n=1 Tax=Nocardioides zeae TaxID=1457234 RepID=A0A6P0HMT7_9ACTN|nr:hypothetical protein [Nocardioides zeae]NEN79537.1 hypothetical protein [Nocardioides zeae]